MQVQPVPLTRCPLYSAHHTRY